MVVVVGGWAMIEFSAAIWAASSILAASCCCERGEVDMRLDDGRSKTQFAVVESRVPPSASCCCCCCCGGLVAVGEGLADGELEVLAARVESILMGCVMTGVVVGGTPSCSRSSTNTHSPDIESAIVAMLSVYLSMRPPTHSDTTERQGHGTPRTVLLYPGDRGVGAVECRSVARALSNWRAALVCCWFGLVPSRCCDRNGTFAPTR